MYLPRSVTRAMAVQLDRVNERADAPKLVPHAPAAVDHETPLHQQIRALEADLARAQARIAELEARLKPQPGAALTLNTRPVITPRAAARAAGVSVATVSRYLTSGRWAGVQDERGRWLVYSDQDLTPKGRRRKHARR